MYEVKVETQFSAAHQLKGYDGQFENLHGHTMHSIHRLDRETSGVLLLARNPKTAQQMTTCFEHDQVRKCYFFISKVNLPSIPGSGFSIGTKIAPSSSVL